MIKALIFDLDGTLADTIDDIGWAVNRMLSENGFPTLERADHLANINNGAFQLIRRSLPEQYREDETFVRARLKEYEKWYSQHYAVDTYAYEGVTEALTVLAEKGYKLSILSNKQDSYVKSIAEKLFANIPFTCAWGQSDLPTKPNPTSALMVAEKMGVLPCETAFIGDSQVDITTAKNAEMHPVGVNWGYRPAEQLISEGAKLIIKSGLDLQAIPELLN